MPAEAEEGLLAKVNATEFLEEMFRHLLEDIDDIVLLHKTHLTVNLCELGLTVSAKVFIAETLDDLEIAVHASHHEKLFQRLG